MAEFCELPTSMANPSNIVTLGGTTLATTESNDSNIMDKLQDIYVDAMDYQEGKCPQCNKTFVRTSSLLSHIRYHTLEKKYACNYCEKRFIHTVNLKNHERIHTKVRPYICNVCNKTFAQVTNLNNHVRLHTGERPYVCMEADCGRSFVQVANLNYHMKSYHNLEEYACKQCEKKFTKINALNEHMQMHDGIKYYICALCPKKIFSQHNQYYNHLKDHGLSFPFECLKCHEKFTQLIHLEKHIKMHEKYKYSCNFCAMSFDEEDDQKKHEERHLRKLRNN